MMDIYSKIAKHIVIPLQYYREGNECLKYVSALEKTLSLDKSTLAELRWRKLSNIIEHAYNNVPYYNKIFKENGITPESIKSPEDMKKIPVLTKNHIREYLRELCAANIPQKRLHESLTGGSTAKPMEFYRDTRCLHMRWAGTVVFNKLLGWDLGDKIALFWGAPADFEGLTGFKARLRNRLIDRLEIMKVWDMNEDTMKHFAKRLQKSKPKVYYGWPGAIFQFANFILNSKMEIEPPKVVVTTAEPLYEAWRTKIETVLTTCVYDRYASREVGHIAQECYRHSSLHINAESIYVEIVENGEIVEPGQIGEIVVTDLMNYGMPLLRYRIEDRGTLVKGSCGCGLELPMMEVNGGRINDFFLKSDGSKLHGNCITDFAIASWKKIKQMQFIQETVENFRVKVVPGPEFQESTMEAIKCELEKKMEQNINLRIEIVNEIPAEESGKYRITKSLVCEEEGQDSYESLFH